MQAHVIPGLGAGLMSILKGQEGWRPDPYDASPCCVCACFCIRIPIAIIAKSPKKATLEGPGRSCLLFWEGAFKRVLYPLSAQGIYQKFRFRWVKKEFGC